MKVEVDVFMESDDVSDEEHEVEYEYNDPLVWWKEHEKQFPNIAILAKALLAIPATSASSERVFSVAGLTVSKNRARLSSSIFASMVYMHEFYRFMKTNPSIILPLKLYILIIKGRTT